MSQRAPGKYLLDTQGGWDKTPCSTLFRNLSRGPPSIPSGVFTRGLGSSSTRTPRPCPFPWCLNSWHSGSLSLNPGPQLPRGAALGASHGCERRSAWRLPRRGTSTPSRPAPHLLTAARPHPSPTGAPGRRLGAASLETQGAGRSGSWAPARLLSQRVRHCKR